MGDCFSSPADQTVSDANANADNGAASRQAPPAAANRAAAPTPPAKPQQQQQPRAQAQDPFEDAVGKPDKPKGSPPPPPSPPVKSAQSIAGGLKSSVISGSQTPVHFIMSLTDGKPLDGSDVRDLADAKNEIRFIRKFAAEFLATVEDDEQKDKDEHRDDRVRGALYDKQDFGSFKKVSYEKTDHVRSLIFDAIKPNVLFEHDTREEILQIIDVFKPLEFERGERVITQGEEGSEFYVVESGTLSIHVTVRGEDDDEPSEVKVGDYSAGSAFGELALIFGSPRAATITATSDCRLWSLERTAYRSVISQLRYEQHLEKNAFLRSCVVSDKPFTEIFDASQIEDLTIATKVDTYEAGEVILREGEMGDTFYILKSGTLKTYKNNGTERYGKIDAKKAFGTTSLVKGTASPLTYRATSQVHVYYLTQKDFEAIMGSVQDAFDGTVVTRSVIKSESKRTIKTTMSMDMRYELQLGDLEHFNLLGRGAFGQVTLVQSRKTKKVFALKAQSKHYIIKKGQKEHVLNEFRIMKEIEHPYILGIHCAMQDEQHLYFLLDLLPGE